MPFSFCIIVIIIIIAVVVKNDTNENTPLIDKSPSDTEKVCLFILLFFLLSIILIFSLRVKLLAY